MRYYNRNRTNQREMNSRDYNVTGNRGEMNGQRRREPRTKLVIDDNTIYEIDLDCLECKEKNKSR